MGRLNAAIATDSSGLEQTRQENRTNTERVGQYHRKFWLTFISTRSLIKLGLVLNVKDSIQLLKVLIDIDRV